MNIGVASNVFRGSLGGMFGSVLDGVVGYCVMVHLSFGDGEKRSVKKKNGGA